MEWLELAALSLATSAASITISRSTLFSPFREFLLTRQGGAWKHLGYLVSCFYCVSHWIAAAVVLAYQPRIVQFWIVVDLGISWLAVVALAALWSGIVLLFTPMGGVRE